VAADVARAHVGVAEQISCEALELALAGGVDALADLRRVFAIGPRGQVVVGEGGDFDVDVDPVEEGAGDAGAVAVDGGRGASTGAPRIREVAARAGVHRAEDRAGLERLGPHPSRSGTSPPMPQAAQRCSVTHYSTLHRSLSLPSSDGVPLEVRLPPVPLPLKQAPWSIGSAEPEAGTAQRPAHQQARGRIEDGHSAQRCSSKGTHMA
jgi:hypothetical protein